MDNRISEALEAMAYLAGRSMPPAAIMMLEEDLANYSPDLVLRALAKCRREVRGFPSLSEIIERIDDGRPGPEEAWGMIPQSESATCVWTKEMATAYAASESLLDQPIQMRLAFLEVYRKELARARSEGVPTEWTASIGHDKTQRERVIRQAVEQGRLTQTQATEFLPEIGTMSDLVRLTGPTEPASDPEQVAKFLAEIREQITKAVP